MDAFKYALKDLSPPINIGDSWAAIKPRVQSLQEFAALDEETCLEVYEKFQRRLEVLFVSLFP